MTVARMYRMHANTGHGGELNGILGLLKEALRDIPGFEDADILQDIEDQDNLVFIEKWTSVGAHAAGAAMVPKPLFATLMTLLSERPKASFLKYT